MWIGHRDDLPLIRRIGKNLLVARHRGVETNLAASGGSRAKAFAMKHGTVFQSQNRLHQN